MMKQTATNLVVLGMLAALVPSVASAQEPANTDEQEAIEGPLKDQLEDYWSINRDLDVIRDRLHTRAGKVTVGVFSGMATADAFAWYIPIGLRGGYFLTDDLGIEVHGQFMLQNTTELTDFITEQRGANFDLASDGYDRFVWRANAVATWHPLYGKFALLQRKLAHLDFNFVGGLGVAGVERPLADRTGSESVINPELVLGAGVSFYLMEGLTLRMEGRGYLSPNLQVDVQEEEDQLAPVQFPIEFIAGVSYTF